MIQDCAGYALLTYSHLHQSGQKRGIGDEERKGDKSESERGRAWLG